MWLGLWCGGGSGQVTGRGQGVRRLPFDPPPSCPWDPQGSSLFLDGPRGLTVVQAGETKGTVRVPALSVPGAGSEGCSLTVSVPRMTTATMRTSSGSRCERMK